MLQDMKKKKISLVDLGTGTDRSLIPLGIGLLKSYAMTDMELSNGFEIDLVILGDNDLDYVVNQVGQSDYVGFACYVWNLLGTSEVSQRLKKHNRSVKIIWGGPSVPQTPKRMDEFSRNHPYVDYFVYGEGEKAFTDLIKELERGAGRVSSGSVFFRDHAGNQIVNPSEPRLTNLDAIPSPYLKGYFDDILREHKSHLVGALWETSRGCPFKCSFCDWGSALVNKINRFSVTRCIEEIEWISRNKLKYVYATDANFGITFERDFEIATKFSDISNRTGFPSTLVLNWTKNSSLKIIDIASAFKSGGVAVSVTLSYQSHNDDTLTAIQRKNIKFDEYFKLKSTFHEKDLPTYTELILGLPEETKATYVAGVEKTISFKLQDQISIYLAIVLENTDLQFRMNEFGLETRKCPVGLNRRLVKFPRFGEEEIVVGTRAMSNSEWQDCYKFTYLFLSLYNLRLLFYPLVYLKNFLSLSVTDFVMFILDFVQNNQMRFKVFSRALTHLQLNIESIMSNESSVLEIDGSGGYRFQPHEAITFFFLNSPLEFYDEAQRLITEFLAKKYASVESSVIMDVFSLQQASIPFFGSKTTVLTFSTDIPTELLRITSHSSVDLNDIKSRTVRITYPHHNYESEIEFNRRRISSGYTMVLPTFTQLRETPSSVTNARNLHLSEFGA